MSIVFVSDNAMDCSVAHAKLASEISLSFAILETETNLANRIVSILGLTSSCFLGVVLHVFDVSAKKEMIGAYARGIVAPVADFYPFGDRAISAGVNESSSPPMLSFVDKAPVAAAPIYDPGPTICSQDGMNGAILVDFVPESFFNGKLAFGPTAIVTRNKPDGLPFDMPLARVGMFGDWCGLPAATFTEFWCVIRGILGVHENLHFSAKPRAFRDVAGHFLLGFYSCNYTTNALKGTT